MTIKESEPLIVAKKLLIKQWSQAMAVYSV